MTIGIPPQVLQEIENLKKEGNYDDAIKLVNGILSRDPNNEDALLQIADLQYQK
ncbi:tetratricopeptide repeat protein [bacterium]|nr:tetratricopeptide repeat protein [bacterium]